MMRDAVLNFSKQFTFEPFIANAGRLQKCDSYVVCGMGGSQLASHLLLAWDPSLPIAMHRDYGLPELPKNGSKKRLYIFSSYSGNTEEVIDAFHQAVKQRLPMTVIAVGGKLIELADKRHVPFIQMPDIGIQPRSALGFSLTSLLSLLELEKGIKEASALAKQLKPASFESTGKKLADALKGRVPIIYSSTRNKAVAYNWKIKLNETGKIPAFYNVFPELNHNEMNGFDVAETSRHLSDRFAFVFLTDETDDKRNQKLMEITKQLFEDRGLPVVDVPLTGKGRMFRIFNSLLTADWTAIHTAELYGLESEQVPMVEEFKRLIV